MTITLHANNVYCRAASAYAAAVESENADKLSAARDKVPMPEHYWQRAHAARLRLEAARAIFEAAKEAAI